MDFENEYTYIIYTPFFMMMPLITKKQTEIHTQ